MKQIGRALRFQDNSKIHASIDFEFLCISKEDVANARDQEPNALAISVAFPHDPGTTIRLILPFSVKPPFNTEYF